MRGESPGIVWSQLSDSALASVSMGYQIGVTPLQMVTAVSSVANGGRLMEPHLVRATDRDGVRTLVQPKVLRETITLETASELTTIMEGVVERGTAKASKIDGFTIAGKTGTAAKLVRGAVLEVRLHGVVRRVLAVAQAGGRDPRRRRLAARPRLHGRRCRGADLQAHRRSGASGTSACRDRSTPSCRCSCAATAREPALSTRVNDRRDVVPAVLPATDRTMPDLRGLSARDALKRMVALGIRPRINGQGFVVAQQPETGASLDRGDRVRAVAGACAADAAGRTQGTQP